MSLTSQEETSYTVTFTITGESSNQTSQTVQEGKTLTRPTDPSRQGYLFDGWFIENTNQAYDFNQPVTTNLTLTTHWSKNTWGISPNQGASTGGNQATITTQPTRGIRFAQICGGSDHNLAISSDGNLYSWGNNKFGQLGDGTTNDRHIPGMVSKPAGVDSSFTWKQAGPGIYHSLALGSDGNLYSWGLNSRGQLGDGTQTNRSIPGLVKKPAGVPDSFTWTQISVGWTHSLALGSDGNLYSWGDNQAGQLGDGTKTNRNIPILVDKPAGVPDSFTWTQISAGPYYSAVLGSDGNIYSCGNDSDGQIGDGTTPRPDDNMLGPFMTTLVRALKPVDGSFTWKQVIAGYNYTLALGSDGNLYGWGDNYLGELGDGTMKDRYTPTKVNKPDGVDANFAWKQAVVGFGGMTSYAFGSDGNLYGWGYKGFCLLGDEVDEIELSPILVSKPAGADANFAWVQAFRGVEATYAFGSDGNLYSWGMNNNGQLGDGTTLRKTRPVLVSIPGNVTLTGVRFANSASTSGPIQQDDGSWLVTVPAKPASTSNPQADVIITWQLDGGTQPDIHLTYTYILPTCTVTFIITGESPDQTSQTVKTVQEGKTITRPTDPTRQGYLFDGWFIQDTNQAYDFTQPVTTNLTLTTHWTKASTWRISPNQGPETGGTQVTLTPPTTRGIRFSHISTRFNYSLAFGSDGNLYSWGNNIYGQLGDGTTNSHSRPVLVRKPAGADNSFTWVQAIAGYWHSLALGSDGNLYSWGWNFNGQLGDGSRNNQYIPVPVKKPGGDSNSFTWTKFSAESTSSFAFGSNGILYSWGDNSSSQLGDGTKYQRLRPGPVSIKPTGVDDSFTWTQFSPGGNTSSFALGSDGNLYAWGYNSYGQLGIGKKSEREPQPVLVSKPDRVSDSFTWEQVNGYFQHTLALDSDGNLYSWGDNRYGQLGDGTTTNQYRPVMVSKPTGVSDSFTWKQAVAGDFMSLALGSDGNLYGWGKIATSEGSEPHKPSLLWKPAGVDSNFTWKQANVGSSHYSALGSDGNLYAWGNNELAQLGVEETTSYVDRPALVTVFDSPVVTGVKFGQTSITGSATRQDDGTWLVTSPEHNPGTVPVTISWKLNQVAQTDDTSNTFTYTPISIIPAAGGTGIIPFLLLGLTIMSITQLKRHQARPTTFTRVSG